MTQPLSLYKRLLSWTGIAAFDRAAIIIVPYDSASQTALPMQHVVEWLSRLKMPPGIARYFITGPQASRAEVERVLSSTRGLKRVKVFLGHGTRDALLGSPQGDTNDIVSDGKPYSVLYDSGMTSANPSALLAYGCNAAQKLGKDFSALPMHSFLGFEGEVILLLADDEQEECMRVWKDIIQKMATRIIRDGAILPKHAEILRNLYDRHLAYFQKGRGKNNREDALFMNLILNGQRENLRKYP
jgi:hypothetical protein